MNRSRMLSIIANQAPRNLLQSPKAFTDAYWAKNNVTVDGDVTLSPGGVTDADRITSVNDTSGGGFVNGNVNVVATTQYKMSVNAKADSVNYLIIRALDAGHGGNAYGLFNVGTGSLVELGSQADNYNITTIGDGWYECEVTFTTTDVTDIRVAYYVSHNDRAFGTLAGSSIFIWNAELFKV